MSVAGLPDLGPVDGAPTGVEVWERAWEQYLHFRGDPVSMLSEAGEADESFVMGPVFASVYRVLGGSPPQARPLAADVGRALARAARAGEREGAHVRALEMLVAGDHTAAAEVWDQIASAERDFAALRFAHDVYLHVGDDERRLASTSRAVEAWSGKPGWGFVAGQHAFALEEVGRYDEAEELGRAALGIDPDDLWARHALAHVYESTDDTVAALDLLEGSVDRWDGQDLLATHIWWHLALRLLASGDAAGALRVFDERQPDATTAFQLCDQTSLLWRLELAGGDGGDRWDALADRWDGVAERHTCGFLDLHAALAFTRRPDHPGAGRWFDGLTARPFGASENDVTFVRVVEPLVEAFRSYGRGRYDHFASIVDGLEASICRIGGSIVQRDLIALTRQAAAGGTDLSVRASAAEGRSRSRSADARSSAAVMPFGVLSMGGGSADDAVGVA